MTTTASHPFVVPITSIGRTDLGLVGGKGANLGELERISGSGVPSGFCVTTAAYARVVRADGAIGALLDRLDHAAPGDRPTLGAVGAELRQLLESAAVPDEVASEIAHALSGRDGRTAWAVRSSATAEDLPSASFAGQHDSFLNVVGTAAVLDHVRRCWASLFSDRAVDYRARLGVEHRHALMAVIVQEMVHPRASGVLFTADPVTSNRTVVSVEATLGLGEALVSGSVLADAYTVRDGVVEASIADKATAIEPDPDGGTQEVEVEPALRDRPALTERQVLDLVETGRRIEAHLGTPQDIEWCFADDGFHIVQSRPITTLFPIPPTDDGANHVYVSVGHQQMMTDPMKPLGLSFWQMTTPAPMAEAGGRLFVDVTARLASPATRDGVLEALGRSDPLIRDALETVLDRGDFVAPSTGVAPAAPPWSDPREPLPADPAIVEDLVAHWRSSLAELRPRIRAVSGPEVFDVIARDIEVLRGLLFDPRSLQVIMAGIDATWWLNERLEEWLGERSAADTLTLSAPGNVTSEMGLALLDVADVIRPHHAVVQHLRGVDEDDVQFLDALVDLPGGSEARDAIDGFLSDYGMRCPGEIDITRPRWVERPGALVAVLLHDIDTFEPGEAGRRVAEGVHAATRKQEECLQGLRRLPDGDAKAAETEAMIERVRTFIGYREYPKYGWAGRYLEYKQALLTEARHLVEAGVIGALDDIDFLTFEELHQAASTGRVDTTAIAVRRESFAGYASLVPPRVLTSEGEALNGDYHRDDVPDGALVGLAVSVGIVEGRARVILDMADADLEPGDILVTAQTDPSWSPLFVAIRGLVTEVGGRMTHGAVVAREYGLPTVVGVEGATLRIEDGRRIRVNGTEGYVELLDR